MDVEKIFVGRKDEIEQFKEVLEDPKGQAVLVVGQAGMGKTWLVNKMAEIAESHLELKCGWVRYEVTPTDSVDSTMALMMDNAFETANKEPGSFDNVPVRKKQWLALLKTIVPKGGEIAELVNSLRRDPAKNTRDQFLERLRLISKRMPKSGRAIFVIDTEKYMQKDCDQSWAIVVKELPEKIMFVFAQRSEDVLVESETFSNLDNVSQIPETRLDVLEEESVDELLNKRMAGLKYSVTEVREVLSRYEGHPYALGAALDLIEDGTKLEELPEKPKPTKFAEVQWREVSNRSEYAIRLFKGYAILEVGVPDDVVEAVSELDSDTRQHFVTDKYIRGLLREEGEGRRIYHVILADYILGQISVDEKKAYHGRAMGVYRGKLARAKKEKTKPDALAAMRLAEHVLAAEGKVAFVYAFVNECTRPLMNLGLLDVAFGFSERALGIVEKYSVEEAVVLGNLGLIYKTKGYLEKAEDMVKKSLEISKKLGSLEGMASEYGNLGLIYQTKGDLDKAKDMHNKSMEINKKLGRLEGMAINYGNLGLIYQTKCDLDKAKDMHNKSLEINKKLGRLESMARDYGNLGLIYQLRGDLDQGEDMHNKSLEINKKLGRLEGMASDYGNLGLIYQMKGELAKAEKMFRGCLEIDEKIGRLEGIASNYGNLGVIYQIRGELDKAEEMHKKSLEIEKKLGHLEGMASEYGNLGNIYRMRSDFEKAKKMYNRVLEIEEKLGRQDSIAFAYNNLGLIYKTRGDLDKAEEMHLKSLKINEKLGLQQGISISYGNLGNVYYMKGDVDKAEEMHKKALEIDEKIDHLEGVARHSSNLGLVYQKRGDIGKAREYWEKAVGLYKKIGMPHMVEKVEEWIREIDK